MLALTEKYFKFKNTQIVPHLVWAVYGAAGSWEKQVLNLGKGPRSAQYLPSCVYLCICCFDWAVRERRKP